MSMYVLETPDGKTPLVRPKYRWENHIKMDLEEIEYEDKSWILLP
jgi:hypothetical protein